MVEAAWHRRNRSAAALLGAAGLVFACWGLTMSAGHIGTNRLQAGTHAAFDGSQMKSLRSDESRLRSDLAKLEAALTVPHGTAIANANFFTTGPGKKTFDKTKACQDATSKSERSFCGRYNSAMADLKNAEAVENSRGELAQVEAKLAAIGPGKVGDGQAVVLASFFTSSADAVEIDGVSKRLSLAQAIVSLVAEITVMRILVMLYGWRPEDLVQGRIDVLDRALDTAVATVTPRVEAAAQMVAGPINTVERHFTVADPRTIFETMQRA
jgi:hypothetical protein